MVFWSSGIHLFDVYRFSFYPSRIWVINPWRFHYGYSVGDTKLGRHEIITIWSEYAKAAGLTLYFALPGPSQMRWVTLSVRSEFAWAPSSAARWNRVDWRTWIDDENGTCSQKWPYTNLVGDSRGTNDYAGERLSRAFQQFHRIYIVGLLLDLLNPGRLLQGWYRGGRWFNGSWRT